MRFATTIASLLTVGMAAAASCAAQNILDACLASTTPQLKACEANDWSCLCDQSINVLTCYNNCPGDDNQFGAEQTKTSYCNAAKAYSTTTTATSTTSSQSATATSVASASASETSTSTSTSTSTASWEQSTSSGAAAPAAMMTGAVHVQGGLAAVLALGLGAVL